jgi:hypothetical protein
LNPESDYSDEPFSVEAEAAARRGEQRFAPQPPPAPIDRSQWQRPWCS